MVAGGVAGRRQRQAIIRTFGGIQQGAATAEERKTGVRFDDLPASPSEMLRHPLLKG